MPLNQYALPWDSQPQEEAELNQNILFHTVLSPVSPDAIVNLTAGAGWRTVCGPKWTLVNSSLLSHTVGPTGRLVTSNAAFFQRTNPVTTGARSWGGLFIPAATGVTTGIWSIADIPNSGTPQFLLQQNGGDIRFYGGNAYRLTFTGVAIPGVPLYIAWSASDVTASASTQVTIAINGVVQTGSWTSAGLLANEYLGSGYLSAAVGSFGEFWGTLSALPAAQLRELSTPDGFWSGIFAPRSILVPSLPRTGWSPLRMSKVEAPWDSQPQQAVEVDWENPLARGLVDVVYPEMPNFSFVRIGRHGKYVGGTITASSQDSANITLLTLLQSSGTYVNFHGIGVGYYVSDSDMFAYQFAHWNDGTLKAIIRSSGSPVGVYTIEASGPFEGAYLMTGTVGNGNPQRAFKNGALVATNNFTGSYFADSRKVVSAGQSSLPSALTLRWNRVLTNDEIAQVSANPWQIFAPCSIWVPSSVDRSAPALSAPTLTSVATTTARPRVTITYPS